MIARENDVLGALRLAGQLVLFFFRFNENELGNQVKNRILCEDVLPHIRDAVSVREGRVSCTGIDTSSVTHIERQEEGRVSSQLRGHINLLKIHCKVYENTGLEQEQPRLRVTVGTVLVDRVLIGLSGSVTFQFKGHNGETVQEDNQIHTLVIGGPDLLHYRENILLVLSQKVLIESGRRFRVHEFQLHVGHLDAMLERTQKTATRLCYLCIDVTDDGILQVRFINLTERLHFLRLGIVEELEQHLTVHGKKAVKTRRLADHIAVILREPVHYEMLVFFFGQNIIHALGTSFLPVTYS